MVLKSTRGVAALGFLLSVGALCGALWLQQVENWFPCALCIIQRYLYLATALAFAGLWLAGPSGSNGGSKTLAPLVLLLAATGAGFALYHVWILAHPGQSCGIDPLQTKLNALPWVQWFPTLFEVDGMCTDPYPPFMGLQLPAWSAVGFLVQCGLGALLLRARGSVITKSA